MKISDVIADMIMDMFDDDTTQIQIQRNDLANQIGCVPSQINYVITSRFTPEAGYRIESHRGGGGYILISRADSKDDVIMSLINSIGSSIDERTAKTHLYNCNRHNLLSDKATALMLSAMLDANFKEIPREYANIIRAKQLKQMLLAYIN